MNNTIVEFLKVHFRSFIREPGIIFWAIFFPVIMALVLGMAFTESSVSKNKVYVVGEIEQDSITERKFKVPGISSEVWYEFKAATMPEAILAMKKGEIQIYLEQKNGEYTYNYDPVNQEALKNHLLLEKLLSGEMKFAEIKAVTTPGSRYIDFLIPGLIALGIMNSCIWGIGYNLIEFRMKKLLRRMLATPMKRSDFLISHLIFRMFVCLIEAVILTGFAMLTFQSEVQGSWLAFAFLFFSGVICFSGIAILLASRAQSSQVGHGLINALVIPMTILSGIFFSYHNFPAVIQSIIRCLPLTILADSMRAVFNEGAGLSVTLLPILLLNGIGVLCFFVGMKIFKWY
jgi:ABC-2 type transport system permease protein